MPRIAYGLTHSENGWHGVKSRTNSIDCSRRGRVRANASRPLTHPSEQAEGGLAVDATQTPTLCACGCGQPAGVYKTSNSAQGIVAGTPKRFIHGHHSRVQPRRGPDFDDCYTVQADGCWRWNRPLDPYSSGYGRFSIRGKHHSAHRYSYERTYGAIPAGAHLDHICHDPKTCPGGERCPHRACVNPDHLAITTHAANCRRGVNSKLDLAKARAIRRRYAAGELGVNLAAEYGVRPSTISWIVQNKTWREAT